MLVPKYEITTELIRCVAFIHELIGSLNSQKFAETVLYHMEKDARALSTFSSTSIEGNVLPLTDVKRILKSDKRYFRDSEKEVVNYNNALLYLDKLIKSGEEITLSSKFICHIQKLVTDDLIPDYASGNYRKKPVFVNDPILRQVAYLPPKHDEVPKLMSDLIRFVNTNEKKLNPLILAGIFHQQFVIIHPFEDGNGRTTRLITKVLLAKLGLNTFQLFSFENYYNLNVSRYFQKVGIRGDYYTEGKNWDFTPWLEYFANGILEELLRVKNLLELPTSLEDRLEDFHYAIMDLIYEKGVVKDSDYAKVTNRSRAARALDFEKLVGLKMIERRGKGRGSYYVIGES